MDLGKALLPRVQIGSTAPFLNSFIRIVSSLGRNSRDPFLSTEHHQPSAFRRGSGRKFYVEGKSSIKFLATNITTRKIAPIKPASDMALGPSARGGYLLPVCASSTISGSICVDKKIIL
jgi:hypothetical protein